MRTLGWLALGAAFVSTPGCNAQGGLAKRRPHVVVSAVEGARPYAGFDDATRTLALGAVPHFLARRAVLSFENRVSEPLAVTGVTLGETAGAGRWRLEAVTRADGTLVDTWPATLPAYAAMQISVTYVAAGAGPDSLRLAMACNADNAVDGVVDAAITAEATAALGAPALAVEYAGYSGPLASECATSFEGDLPVLTLDADGSPIIRICRVPLGRALEFGNIGLGLFGASRLRLRNLATCPAIAAAGECDACAITVAPDPAQHNVGLGFVPGLDTAGVFTLDAAASTTPLVLRQASVECGESGALDVAVTMHSPEIEGEHATTIAVESDAPNAPLVEIAVHGAARNAPVAILAVGTSDPQKPALVCADPASIQPLDYLCLDGRGSYDPSGPTDPKRLVDYLYEIVQGPDGATAADLQVSGFGTARYSLRVPLAGHYVMRLTVKNKEGLTSGDTPSARIEVDAIPKSRIHIQLTWDTSTDQDLHLVRTSPPGVDKVCEWTSDCFWQNCTPVPCTGNPSCALAPIQWDLGAPANTGANPSLALDDKSGYGPEDINVAEPFSGTYRIYVHYFYAIPAVGYVPTRNTVRIYLNGTLRGDSTRLLTQESEVWAVGDIVWHADNTADLVPYTSDVANEVGALKVMPTNACVGGAGWSF